MARAQGMQLAYWRRCCIRRCRVGQRKYARLPYVSAGCPKSCLSRERNSSSSGCFSRWLLTPARSWASSAESAISSGTSVATRGAAAWYPTSRATLVSSRLKFLEAQFPGKIQASNVVPTSNPTSVCADSEAEREVDELKVEDREVEPPGLPKACSEATGRLPEYGRP